VTPNLLASSGSNFAATRSELRPLAVVSEEPQMPKQPAIDPANFVDVIDNPYFPLTPGTTFTYESRSPDGALLERVETTVTSDTKEILGVTCVVVEDKTYDANGNLIESTLDYFAQDVDGNVWYFGEDTRSFEDGHVSKEGSWLAGKHVPGGDIAEPGIIMLASPDKGDIGVTYQQENAPGIAQDEAKVVDLNEVVMLDVNDDKVTYNQVIVTEDINPLEDPVPVENKFYAPNVGLVLTIDVNTGESLELVGITTSDTESVTASSFSASDFLHTI
jgi:hypothetical protein